MNIPIPTNTHATGEFVFRSADRMRIDGCANAVAREGLSLGLFCEHEVLLDHYTSLLLAQLRQQAPEHSIEVYFPANTESLLTRFNEVLASQSVQQATRNPTTVDGAKIWIVHDAHNLPEAEVQLLARLIQNFPGANIRAILLMSGLNRQNINLSSFGRKVLRWDIETPNSEQIQAALDTANSEGRSGPLVQMLKRLASPLVANTLDDPRLLASTLSDAVDPPPPDSSFKQKILGWHQVGQSTLQHMAGLKLALRPRTWIKQTKTVTWLLMAGLALSTLLMLWLQPQSFGIKTPTQPAVKSTPTATSPSVSKPTNDVAPTPASAASTAESPVPKESASPVVPPVINPIPQVANTGADIRQTKTWVKSLDPQSFLLQYGTAKTMDKAVEVLKGLSDVKNTAIVEAFYPGDSVAHFVIVSGPYTQVNEGYVAARKPGIPNGSWVRSTRTLQAQIDPASPKQDTPR